MNFSISTNEYFSVDHSYLCAVPGYLIVSPTIAATSIIELPPAAQLQLGPTLAFAAEMTTNTVRPLKVYCAQYAPSLGRPRKSRQNRRAINRREKGRLGAVHRALPRTDRNSLRRILSRRPRRQKIFPLWYGCRGTKLCAPRRQRCPDAGIARP